MLNREISVEGTTAEGARRLAIGQALLVTFLWSTSWVLIKIGLVAIPALTFAGLRYGLAFLCLLPLLLGSGGWRALRQLAPADWGRLAALGLLFYAITQGAQFLALFYLPAITVNLLLSFTTVVVAGLGILFLGERPSLGQWAGIALYLVGALIYFYPAKLPAGQLIGVLVAVAGVLANGMSAVLGRHVNRGGALTPLTVTVVSMGIGSAVLLLAGWATQDWPRLGLAEWAIILWLAVVNSAFAFTLWNHTLRTLPAVESTLINNTMMIQIPILAWLFLGERPSLRNIAGLVIAAAGIFLVQLKRAATARRRDRRPA